jgi:hypothetical protein
MNAIMKSPVLLPVVVMLVGFLGYVTLPHGTKACTACIVLLLGGTAWLIFIVIAGLTRRQPGTPQP